MPDQRESFFDPEEALRAAWAGLRNHIFTALPVLIPESSPDGHTATLQVSVKREEQNADYTETTYKSFPPLVDAPIKYPGGGGVTLTHPVAEGDEGLAIFASRSIDAWHQSGGEQQPVYNRLYSLADAFLIPGVRSDPRKLQQVSSASAQLRGDDKRAVLDHHPQNGTHIKAADPSTAPASPGFDPFVAASKFFESLVHPSNGVSHAATDSGTSHTYSLTHAAGHALAVLNGLHQVLAHPDLGALLSAASGAHTVKATPSGVQISSTSEIGLSAPSLSLPSGSVGGAALGSGAASDNVGTLGGDLSGTLPDPQVVSILHVSNANLLPNAADDAAAAALGVVVGALYRNGSALYVRVA